MLPFGVLSLRGSGSRNEAPLVSSPRRTGRQSRRALPAQSQARVELGLGFEVLAGRQAACLALWHLGTRLSYNPGVSLRVGILAGLALLFLQAAAHAAGSINYRARVIHNN